MGADASIVTIYADYVCPFCYLGQVSLDRYRSSREEPIEVQWHPFDLRSRQRGPEGELDESIDDGKDEAYFDQVRRNVDRLRERYNVDVMRSIDEVPDVDSFNAQLVSLHVKRRYPDRWSAFDDRMYDALWVHGLDIGDVSVLVDLAESVDLPAGEITEVIEDEALRRDLRNTFKDAYASGVRAVPTLVYGDHAVRGAVPPAQLRRLIEGVEAI